MNGGAKAAEKLVEKTRENPEEVNGSRLKELPVWYKIKLSSMLIRFQLAIPHQMFSFTLVAQLSSNVVKIKVKKVFLNVF